MDKHFTKIAKQDIEHVLEFGHMDHLELVRTMLDLMTDEQVIEARGRIIELDMEYEQDPTTKEPTTTTEAVKELVK